MRGCSSCARLLSGFLISNINREPDDDGNRTAAHDLSQNTRVPRRVPAGADLNDALENDSGVGGVHIQERVPSGCRRVPTSPLQQNRTAAHDLLQNTRAPRRVPAGADFIDA